MKQTNLDMFKQFQTARADRDLEELRNRIEEGGYSCFSRLLEQFKHMLKICDDVNLREATEMISRARRIIPEPGTISPAWVYVWDEFEKIIQYKEEVLQKTPLSDRDGEWQIVMDNPFTNEGVVCYPALSFIEAAYLYGYFRDGLKKNEYIRIQKVMNLLVTEGDKEHQRRINASSLT